MAGGGQSAGYAQGGQVTDFLNQQAPMGGFNTQSGYNNFASPNQNFMQYPQQGQPNQAQQSTPSPLTSMPPPVQAQQSPDNGGAFAPANMGYDGSGSDAGIGGQPVNQMQSPVQWQGNKPPNMSNFTPSQGLQIQGNPTSQVVQRPQQR